MCGWLAVLPGGVPIVSFFIVFLCVEVESESICTGTGMNVTVQETTSRPVRLVDSG
jgi:hypothetical protein